MDAEQYDIDQKVRLSFYPNHSGHDRQVVRGPVEETSRHAVKFTANGRETTYIVYLSGDRAGEVHTSTTDGNQYHGQVGNFQPEWLR